MHAAPTWRTDVGDGRSGKSKTDDDDDEEHAPNRALHPTRAGVILRAHG
jgi:hypothetical protein